MKTLTRTRSIGGSLVVTIPKEIVKAKFLIENEIVEIDIEKMKLSGFGSIKGIKKFTKEDRMDDRF